jgi:hypothetical protein
MHKFFFVFLLTSLAFAEPQRDHVMMKVIPPRGGESATVYNSPGFNFGNCPIPACKKYGWIPKGRSIPIQRENVIINGMRYHKLIMPIRENPNEILYGYIPADYLEIDRDYKYYDPDETVDEPEPSPPPRPAPKAQAAPARPPPCRECGRTQPLPPATKEVLKEVAKKAKEKALPRVSKDAFKAAPNRGPHRIPALADPEKFNTNCHNFIKPNGDFGPWGDKMKKAIEEMGEKCFMDGINVRSVCPKFSKFNPGTKYQFWNYVAASMSVIESSCDEKIEVPGVNDMAVGLFQMEKHMVKRAAAGRDPNYCKTTKEIDPTNVDFQIECTVWQMKDWCCDRKYSLTQGNGYWQELRGKDSDISQLVAQFPGCK